MKTWKLYPKKNYNHISNSSFEVDPNNESSLNTSLESPFNALSNEVDIFEWFKKLDFMDRCWSSVVGIRREMLLWSRTPPVFRVRMSYCGMSISVQTSIEWYDQVTIVPRIMDARSPLRFWQRAQNRVFSSPHIAIRYLIAETVSESLDHFPGHMNPSCFRVDP